MLENLDQFLKERGHETPYSFGRALYKYTDCGPWVAFIVETKPAQEVMEVAKVVNRNGKPWLENTNKLSDGFVKFLGFKKFAYRGKTDTYQDYMRLLDNYIEQKCVGSSANRKINVDLRFQPNFILVETKNTAAAERKTVYYEDSDVNTFDHSKCVGLRIGSIVEGSDVEIGPHELLFPFEMDEFDQIIEDINSEASFYWDRDNSHWYCVVSHGNVGLKETWGEFTWEDPEGDIPVADRQRIEDFISNDKEYRGYDETFTIGDYVLCEYLNDCIY